MNVKNVRIQNGENPTTGEKYTNILFDTKIISINKSWTGYTGGTGKPYQLCTIDTPKGAMTANLPQAVEAKVGDEVTVSSSKVTLKSGPNAGKEVTSFQVIGLPNGGSADASFFEELMSQAAKPAGDAYERAADAVNAASVDPDVY